MQLGGPHAALPIMDCDTFVAALQRVKNDHSDLDVIIPALMGPLTIGKFVREYWWPAGFAIHPAAPSAAAPVLSFQTALHDFLDAPLALEDPAAESNEATSSVLVLLTALKDVMQWTTEKPGAGPGLEQGLLQQSFGTPAVRHIPASSMFLTADISSHILSC